MSTTNVLEKPSVAYVEEVLERAIIDSEFRTELLLRPEEFGITQEDIKNLILPMPVEKQDMSFVELVKETTDLVVACASTCISGLTYRCDGYSIGGDDDPAPDPPCRSTCISGFTISCDGNTL